MPPKRKSDATAEVANKKTRLDADHTVAAGLVDIILADPKNFEIPDDDDELRDNMLALAKYARHLRDVACSTPAAPPAQPAAASNAAAKKSPEDLTAAAERLRKAAASGVKKQMVVSTHINRRIFPWGMRRSHFDIGRSHDCGVDAGKDCRCPIIVHFLNGSGIYLCLKLSGCVLMRRLFDDARLYFCFLNISLFRNTTTLDDVCFYRGGAC